MDSKQFNRERSNGISAGREGSRWKDERIAELEALNERLADELECLLDHGIPHLLESMSNIETASAAEKEWEASEKSAREALSNFNREIGMGEREQFEEWYSEADTRPFAFERVVSDERYASMEVEWAYRAWQARADLAAERIAELKARERDLVELLDEARTTIDAFGYELAKRQAAEAGHHTRKQMNNLLSKIDKEKAK